MCLRVTLVGFSANVYFKLCCPLSKLDESRSVSSARTSLSDALFCLGP